MFGFSGSVDSEEDLKELIGEKAVNKGFLSTGSTARTGFILRDEGQANIIYECPPGTEMIYAEPFSRNGRGDRREWDGLSSQDRFSGELETIINQGYEMEIKDIVKNNDGTFNFYIKLLTRKHIPK